MPMDAKQLQETAKRNGVVGAGGVGFPTFMKLLEQTGTVILNCAECEPLMQKDQALLSAFAPQILSMLEEVREALQAEEAVIGIRGEKTEAFRAVTEAADGRKGIRTVTLADTYPAGDEIVLIYECTGRVISPGRLPVEEKVAVFNPETMLNLYRAVHQELPVTEKAVAVLGEVGEPSVMLLPVGTALKDAAELAGGITAKDAAFYLGGPMMGHPVSGQSVVTKTTGAVIVLERSHPLIERAGKNLTAERRRTASVCCQCRTCTDLCPRHMLGYPIEPHRMMRAVSGGEINDLSVYTDALYCSGCGICEKYACPQGLSPRAILMAFKDGLRKAGVRAEKTEALQIEANREFRRVPTERLTARLGLAQYRQRVLFDPSVKQVKTVRIPLLQHAGAPAVPAVREKEGVRKSQLIAEAGDGLSAGIHASVDGIVTEINEREIIITNVQ